LNRTKPRAYCDAHVDKKGVRYSAGVGEVLGIEWPSGQATVNQGNLVADLLGSLVQTHGNRFEGLGLNDRGPEEGALVSSKTK